MLQAQPLTASLEDGSTYEYKEFHVATHSNPGVEINGIAARFTGNFSAYPPDSMTIAFPNCWFSPAAGNVGIAWEFASDSSYVDLEVWDTSSATYSGYGMFLEFYRSGGIGSLELDDLLKMQESGLTIESVRVLHSPPPVKLYPNPANTSQTIRLSGLSADSQISIAGMDGRVVANLQATSSSVQLPTLKPGAYIVTSRSGEAKPQVKKLMVY